MDKQTVIEFINMLNDSGMLKEASKIRMLTSINVFESLYISEKDELAKTIKNQLDQMNQVRDIDTNSNHDSSQDCASEDSITEFQSLVGHWRDMITWTKLSYPNYFNIFTQGQFILIDVAI